MIISYIYNIYITIEMNMFYFYSAYDEMHIFVYRRLINEINEKIKY